jgi:hypothetical protein
MDGLSRYRSKSRVHTTFVCDVCTRGFLRRLCILPILYWLIKLQGAGKGKIVVTRNPDDAAQSGDAFMVAGGATDTANDRTTDGAAQTEALLAHTGVS